MERFIFWFYSPKGEKTRQRIIWFCVAAILILMANLAFATEGEGTSKEVSGTASSFDIPAGEIWKYRALDAEAKAITFESTKAIQQRNRELHALLETWKKRHGIKDLKLWRVDTDRYRIFRIRKAPAVRAKRND